MLRVFNSFQMVELSRINEKNNKINISLLNSNDAQHQQSSWFVYLELNYYVCVSVTVF